MAQDLAGISVEHFHHLVVAGGEEPMMRSIKRDAGRFFSGRERPMRHDFMLRGVDHCDFAFVLEVNVNATGR